MIFGNLPVGRLRARARLRHAHDAACPRAGSTSPHAQQVTARVTRRAAATARYRREPAQAAHQSM
ncbi:hypothetical protein BL254_02175 [Protofrankia sp. BMG5.30]|nr:hypothetical protein BL254_02175 [Protofrankia sp. BMG5.30]